MGSITSRSDRNSTTSDRVLTGITSTPLTMEASTRFPNGTMTPAKPLSFAAIAAERTPGTDLTLPSRESSPTMRNLEPLSRGTILDAQRIPTATGRSRFVPSFLMAAGARFTIILSPGNLYPEFFTALLTLSRLSRTAVSGSPTMLNTGIPKEISTSTSTI